MHKSAEFPIETGLSAISPILIEQFPVLVSDEKAKKLCRILKETSEHSSTLNWRATYVNLLLDSDLRCRAAALAALEDWLKEGIADPHEFVVRMAHWNNLLADLSNDKVSKQSPLVEKMKEAAGIDSGMVGIVQKGVRQSVNFVKKAFVQEPDRPAYEREIRWILKKTFAQYIPKLNYDYFSPVVDDFNVDELAGRSEVLVRYDIFDYAFEAIVRREWASAFNMDVNRLFEYFDTLENDFTQISSVYKDHPDSRKDIVRIFRVAIHDYAEKYLGRRPKGPYRERAIV